MGNFAIDLKVGEIGENVVVNFFKNNEHVEDIIDVRSDEIFQRDDIDFLIYTDKNIIIPIEVKTDTMAHRTGNIAYEVFSNKHYNTKGCFEKTKAKYMYYYLVETDVLFQIDVKKLREHIDTYYRDKKRMIPMGDAALGFLIRIKELLNNEVMKKVKG